MNEEKPQQSTPNFNDLEKEILKFWDENKIFEKSLEQTKPNMDPAASPRDERHEPFIFYDGPPFATGLPHYGHILSSVAKDFFGRYQTMHGRYVRRRWGWDCHGLPIENIVEQHLKISGKKQIEEIGVERFNKICRENVLKFVEEWGKTVNRMGRWVDFNNSYKTMDATYMESVWWGLKQTWEKGLIYEDRRVLMYCSRCETPVSNFEVAMDNSYRDITEESVYAKFKLIPRQRIRDDLINDKTFVLAWTTTPWTLPGNTSLNVGPDIVYVMIEMDDGPDFAKASPSVETSEDRSADKSSGKERYILAKERLSIIDGKYEIVMEFPARSLEGLEYEPLYEGVIPDARHEAPAGYPPLVGGNFNRAHKIYLANFVTTTDGTGIVHNAAMYGEEDYQLAREKDLPRVDMLDHKGQYLPIAPQHLRGVFFKDADKIVLADLAEKGLVYKTENYTHSYPHCHRCGTPLFYNAIPAWFINIQKIKPQLRQLNEQEIAWHPEHLKMGRFDKSMESAPDWNISRNRYWATALPFWKCQNQDCRLVSCIGSVKELKEEAINFDQVYFNYNPSNIDNLDLHRPYIDNVELKCPKCGGAQKRVPEVVDCWVESASMPFAELHYPFEHNGESSPEDFKNRFPADFVAEYIGQVRAWFYVMLVQSAVLFEHAPFKNVLTSGNILAEDGSKMSKSKKNFPDPSIIIEKFGVDALRFYLMTCPVMNADDVAFSERGVQEVNRKLSLILYNVWSFYRMYEPSSAKATEGKKEKLKVESHVLDQWIMAKLNQTGFEVTKYLDGYDTVRAGKAILEFVNELSTWYVRRSRERVKSAESGEALQTLGYVLAQTAKLLAPFMPFLADFIYRDVTEAESVHLAPWTVFSAEVSPVLEQMAVLRELVETGLSLRKDSRLKVRQPLAELEYHLKNKQTLSPELEAVLAEEMNVKIVSGRGDFVAKNGWVFKDVQNFKLALNTVLTDELKAEGLARELERQVQDLRKKSGLKVGDLVDVYYNTQSEALEGALLNLLDRKKTFVSQIAKSFEIETDFEAQAEVEGQAIWVGMIKI